jgi:hypothetical protein
MGIVLAGADRWQEAEAEIQCALRLKQAAPDVQDGDLLPYLRDLALVLEQLERHQKVQAVRRRVAHIEAQERAGVPKLG